MDEEQLALGIEQWLDRALDPEAAARLRVALDDPARLEQARAQVITHRLLIEGARSDAEVVAAWAVCAQTLSPSRQQQIGRAIAQRLRRPWRPAPRLLVAAGLLLLIGAGILGWSLLTQPDTSWHDHTGTRAIGHGAVVQAPMDGNADLRWEDGSLVTLSAGTRVTNHPDQRHRLALAAGEIDARITPQPQPLVIATPHGTATVLGTEFMLASDADGTWLGVRHGTVRLAAEHSAVTATAGQAAHLDRTGVQLVKPWSDQRPVAMCLLANVQRPPGNPAGWFSDPTIDLTTPEGRARFAQRIDALAELTVTYLREHDAQGVIFGDIEGNNPRAPTYPGDPRLLPDLAPEMDALADGLFARFRQAGFAVGVRLGVHPWTRTPDRRWLVAPDDRAMSREAIARARYAHERWGCTLFFLGHNLTQAGLQAYAAAQLEEAHHACSTSVIAAIQQAVPQSLVIVEYAAPGTWAIAPVLTSSDSASIARWRQAAAHWPGARPALWTGREQRPAPDSVLQATRAAGGLRFLQVPVPEGDPAKP